MEINFLLNKISCMENSTLEETFPIHYSVNNRTLISLFISYATETLDAKQFISMF